jgi:hypothetical protein
MLDAVYIDTKNNVIVAIKPKPPFRPVFQVAAYTSFSSSTPRLKQQVLVSLVPALVVL